MRHTLNCPALHGHPVLKFHGLQPQMRETSCLRIDNAAILYLQKVKAHCQYEPLARGVMCFPSYKVKMFLKLSFPVSVSHSDFSFN